MQSNVPLMVLGAPDEVLVKDLGEVASSEKESGVVSSPFILLEAPCNNSLQRTWLDFLNIPKEGEVPEGVGFQKENCLPLVNIA